MKKKILISVVIIFLLVLLLVLIRFISNNRYSNYSTIKGTVVIVYDKSLTILETGSSNSLYNMGFTEEGNIGFKKGQEVLIYYDGAIQESYPATPTGVKKIKI